MKPCKYNADKYCHPACDREQCFFIKDINFFNPEEKVKMKKRRPKYAN